MKNETPEEHNNKTFAFLIIIALVITTLMRGVNTRMDVPHVLYVIAGAICGLVSAISYIAFIYNKMFKTAAPELLQDMLKIVVLGVMVYFTLSFSVGVLVNL